MPPRRALLSGITGQDGAYLAELLLAKGYEVFGIKRRTSLINTSRIDPFFDRVRIYYGDMLDGLGLTRLVGEIQPHEVYNLAAQSHVGVSFEVPEYTMDVVALGTLRLLEAIRVLKLDCRVYQASSSEMFGASPPPQNEETPFRPRSPYAVAKVAAYNNAVLYRQAYGIFVSNGILFNHESPLRGETFVTRKITRAMARIKLGLQDRLVLGNLDARRDWGHARDFVEAMHLITTANQPDDFVIATGQQRTVWEFVQAAERCLGVEPGSYELATSKRYERPAEVESLCGDARKAEQVLGWKPKTSFDALVREMCEADLSEAKREALCAV